MLILDGQVVQWLILQHGQIHGIVGRHLRRIVALWRTLKVNGRHIGIGQRLLMCHIAGTDCMSSRIRTVGTACAGAQMLRIDRRLRGKKRNRISNI